MQKENTFLVKPDTILSDVHLPRTDEHFDSTNVMYV